MHLMYAANSIGKALLSIGFLFHLQSFLYAVIHLKTHLKTYSNISLNKPTADSGIKKKNQWCILHVGLEVVVPIEFSSYPYFGSCTGSKLFHV